MSSDIETYLAEVEKRAEEARPGTWVREDIERAFMRDARHAGAIFKEGWAEGYTLPTAEFIAHARTDIPRLVAELRKTRAALANCRALIELKFGNTDATANAVMEQADEALEGNHE